MSLETSPTLPTGTVMCIFTIGSSKLGRASRNTFANALPAGDAKRRFVGIDRVVLAEMHFDADVLHRVAGHDARRDFLQKALFDRRHKVAGNRAAHHRIDPEEIVLLVEVRVLEMRKAFLGGEILGLGALGERIHANVHFAELAGAARLLLVPVAAFGVGLDRFAIRDFRLVRFDLDFVAALEPLAEAVAGATRSCR